MTTANKTLDPVCGMTVTPERAAAHVTHDGQDFYFCSKGCAAKFQQDPARYLASPGSSPMQSQGNDGGLIQFAAAAPQSSTPASSYICPMDPEVRSSRPGACPMCGMALEPETIVAHAVRT